MKDEAKWTPQVNERVKLWTKDAVVAVGEDRWGNCCVAMVDGGLKVVPVADLRPLAPAAVTCGCEERPWECCERETAYWRCGSSGCWRNVVCEPTTCTRCGYALKDGHAEKPAPAPEKLDEEAVLDIVQDWMLQPKHADHELVEALCSRFGVPAAPPPDVREKAVLELMGSLWAKHCPADVLPTEFLVALVDALASAHLLAGSAAPVDRAKLVEAAQQGDEAYADRLGIDPDPARARAIADALLASGLCAGGDGLGEEQRTRYTHMQLELEQARAENEMLNAANERLEDGWVEKQTELDAEVERLRESLHTSQARVAELFPLEAEVERLRHCLGEGKPCDCPQITNACESSNHWFDEHVKDGERIAALTAARGLVPTSDERAAIAFLSGYGGHLPEGVIAGVWLSRTRTAQGGESDE